MPHNLNVYQHGQQGKINLDTAPPGAIPVLLPSGSSVVLQSLITEWLVAIADTVFRGVFQLLSHPLIGLPPGAHRVLRK